MDGFQYTFAALRGIQAGREYYVAMCPLRLLPKIFEFDSQDLPPELRAQRVLNKSRIPAITRYIVEHPHDYVFSAITASIDGPVQFKPFEEHGVHRNIGQLIVPLSARFIINDGQHRRAVIEEALREMPDLGDETIAVVFFLDAGLKRSQQIFADLNTHAVRASSSIGILYDFRSPLAYVARRAAAEVPAFKGLTEMERSSIANRSLKLFTLSGIYYATGALLRKEAEDEISPAEEQIAIDYWTALCTVIPEWNERVIRATSSLELRRDYIHFHSVTLHALGIVGADLIATYPRTWREHLTKLRSIDWRRTNPLWEGRAMVGGQLSKARAQIIRTANAIKQVLGLPLSPEELRLEHTSVDATAAFDANHLETAS
ncbi:DNA sulfur modification protein DndB [Chloroflexus sp.]|uniref:DNA sulfur modification protein DndB n=1 Tax=Chloroflexus sp. TaxID=1904827 RepID=UPI002ACE960B|nr:DNA sulfur modification protein DndB [Chloroflexus sp.]